VFIVFEGIDGSGKTTQIKLLESFLLKQGIDVLVTREPGGTDFAEEIRNILLQGKFNISPKEQLMLIVAARHNHYYQIILPAIKQNKIVICDRFIHSTIAYQGYGAGIDIDFIKDIHNRFDCLVEPDITIILDANYDDLKKYHKNDTFERKNKHFFENVIKGYHTLANEKDNIFLVKRNSDKIYTVHQNIIKILNIDKTKSKNIKG
jgi:dTMP kinase